VGDKLPDEYDQVNDEAFASANAPSNGWYWHPFGVVGTGDTVVGALLKTGEMEEVLRKRWSRGHTWTWAASCSEVATAVLIHSFNAGKYCGVPISEVTLGGIIALYDFPMNEVSVYV
jgi:hypothetical protein